MSDSSSSDSSPQGTDLSKKLNKSTTPVALRTRHFSSQVSFRRAAELGQCKICPARFDSPRRLRKHVINHKSNAKRRKALEAQTDVSSLTEHMLLFENLSCFLGFFQSAQSQITPVFWLGLLPLAASRSGQWYLPVVCSSSVSLILRFCHDDDILSAVTD
ncbi:hypothetical protein NPIL_52181 [Nephila pilipes]|uniref:C2H2-type domain-containing protein n=1 Tax=Nephila pilipes TaxID=299642 RepID=A0A8X6NRP7_NEPPI|nr:hypothetical protein NPIL_52181 [Nephila pilipes]